MNVKDAQKWLNDMFEDSVGWVKIEEDGVAGYNTMVAFVRALQILLEIDVDGGFGNNTKQAYNNLFINGLSEVNNADNNFKVKTIISLVNLALLCRIEVSNTDDISLFSEATRQGVISTMSQLGIDNYTGGLRAREIKALFTSDAYYLISNGDATTREIQQAINRKYSDMLDSYIATNGLYDRNMNTALIKMIQYEIGTDVDGGWGEGTMSSLPVLGPGSSRTNLVYILQYLLYLNGFDPNGFDGGFGNGVTIALKDFQELMRLDVDGYCGRQVWSALIVSCGDTTRSTDACDTRYEITDDRLEIIKNAGFRIIGRYINNNTFNGIRDGELERIYNSGLKVFFIYQENVVPKLNNFNFPKGNYIGVHASSLARKHRLPEGTIIYFAVDMDVYEEDIESNIIPFFEGINSSLDTNYKIGVYGPREVCNQLSSRGLTCSSFVADMSYGFSCNIGKKMPRDWCYEQYKEISDYNGHGFDLDKDMYSEAIPATNKFHSGIYNYDSGKNEETYSKIEEIYNYCNQYCNENNLDKTVAEKNILVLQFVRENIYKGSEWDIVVGSLDNDWINFIREKTNNFNPQMLYLYKNNNNGNYIKQGLVHWAITTEGMMRHYIEGKGFTYKDVYYNDLSGWAGDLLQAVGEFAKKDKEPSEDKLYRIFGSSAESYFDIEDLNQDADAQNLYWDLLSKPIYTVLRDYYSSNKQCYRYTEFVRNLYLYGDLEQEMNPTEQSEEIVYQLSKRYLTSEGEVLENILSWLFNIRKWYVYDKSKYGDIAAKAFAKRISEMVKAENSTTMGEE